MAPVTSRQINPNALGPLDRLPTDLHPRERSIHICHGLNQFVVTLLKLMRKGEVYIVKHPGDVSFYLKRHANTLTSLCAGWVDEDMIENSPRTIDLIEVATERAKFIGRQVTLMIEGIGKNEMNNRIVVRSGQKMMEGIMNLVRLCGRVTLSSWCVGARHGLLDYRGQLKIYFRKNTLKLPDVGDEIIENFMSCCNTVVIESFEECIACLIVCERLAEHPLKPGSLVYQYLQVLRQLRVVLFKTRDFLQMLLDEGVGRPAWDAQRHPLQYHHTMYWRFQSIVSRLKAVMENGYVMVDITDRLVIGQKSARKRLIRFSATMTDLADQVLELHIMELPTMTNFRNEVAMNAADGKPAVYRSDVENFRLLDSAQIKNLKCVKREVDMATHKLVGHLNKFIGI